METEGLEGTLAVLVTSSDLLCSEIGDCLLSDEFVRSATGKYFDTLAKGDCSSDSFCGRKYWATSDNGESEGRFVDATFGASDTTPAT